jgi:hypothetical protein
VSSVPPATAVSSRAVSSRSVSRASLSLLVEAPRRELEILLSVVDFFMAFLCEELVATPRASGHAAACSTALAGVSDHSSVSGGGQVQVRVVTPPAMPASSPGLRRRSVSRARCSFFDERSRFEVEILRLGFFMVSSRLRFCSARLCQYRGWIGSPVRRLVDSSFAASFRRTSRGEQALSRGIHLVAGGGSFELGIR